MAGKIMGEWQIQEAKARFTELVRKAQVEGPQRITRFGRPVAVVISEEAFGALETGTVKPSLYQWMMSLEPLEFEAPARDSTDTGRDVQL